MYTYYIYVHTKVLQVRFSRIADTLEIGTRGQRFRVELYLQWKILWIYTIFVVIGSLRRMRTGRRRRAFAIFNYLGENEVNVLYRYLAVYIKLHY